jgi:Domain of unknown function (DUF1905)/Bacteriocin-protection, YdeI or OmpD-Associated
MRFRATLELGGKTATGIEVPAEVVAALGSSKRPAVKVTLNGHGYASTVAPMGGRYLVPVSAEHRAAAGIAAGDEVEVELVLDTAPRVVVVPADLRVALADEPTAAQRFAALSYSHQRAHVLSVEGAKAAETRARRVAKVVDTLLGG